MRPTCGRARVRAGGRTIVRARVWLDVASFNLMVMSSVTRPPSRMRPTSLFTASFCVAPGSTNGLMKRLPFASAMIFA